MANAAVEQASAAKSAVQTAHESMVKAQRAWVGPYNASIASEPSIGKPIEITIEYKNSGREPALAFIYSVQPFLTTPEEDSKWPINTKILNYMNICRSMNKWQGGSVIYPSTGMQSYNLYTKTSDDFVDDDFITSNKIIIVQGCFSYVTFDTPKYSYFCYFYRQGFTKLQNLNICNTGHDAN